MKQLRISDILQKNNVLMIPNKAQYNLSIILLAEGPIH